MKLFPFLIIAVICSTLATAQKAKQEPSSATYIQNPGEILPIDVLYKYPQFMVGTVFFKNSSNTNAMLNYNQVTEEMQFIDPKGDTLAIANTNDVAFITIGTDSFYLFKGAGHVIGTYPAAKLAVKVKLREVDRQKIGGYGMSSSTSAVNNYSSIQDNNKSRPLVSNEKIVYVKEPTYFLVVGEDQFLPVTKNNVVKTFSKKGKVIEQFISAEQIDLKKEADIRKLLSFASGL